MSPRKERLTVTVDPELVEAGTRAVAAGSADSLSSWVNEALSDRALKDRRLEAMAVAVVEYEAEHGEITDAEMTLQLRLDRERAVVVRGERSGA
jgi:glycerol dehydrogenase-like iron-containing ADH family enzyme